MPISFKAVTSQSDALLKLAEITRAAILSPEIVEAARALTSDCISRDEQCEISAIYWGVKNGDPRVPGLKKGLRYVSDPLISDLYTTPQRMLKLCQRGACAGDCDCHSALVAALLGALGYDVGLRAWGPTRGDELVHVYPVVLYPKQGPGQKWIGLDTTVAEAVPGWEPSKGRILTANITRMEMHKPDYSGCNGCGFSGFGAWIEIAATAAAAVAKYGPDIYNWAKNLVTSCAGCKVEEVGNVGSCFGRGRYYDKDVAESQFCASLFPPYETKFNPQGMGVDDTRIDWNRSENQLLKRCLIKSTCLSPPNSADGKGLVQRGLALAAEYATRMSDGSGIWKDNLNGPVARAGLAGSPGGGSAGGSIASGGSSGGGLALVGAAVAAAFLLMNK